jgi:hypothetical protein
MDDPMSYGPSSRDTPHAARGRDAQSSRLLVESVDVPDVKWHWEPDDGSKRWVPYDAPLCQKLERNFQLWIMAKSATCAICMARRAAFPYDPATIESTFIHAFRPDVQWRFRFAMSESGKSMRHVQVLLLLPPCALAPPPSSHLTSPTGKHDNRIETRHRTRRLRVSLARRALPPARCKSNPVVARCQRPDGHERWKPPLIAESGARVVPSYKYDIV